MKRCLLSVSALVALLYPAGPQYAQGPPGRGNLVETALDSVRVATEGAVQYDYVMTARVRLLLFWAGKDDVGGGYIRRGRLKEEPRKEFFQVLFGSDPAKAPRGINRWGPALRSPCTLLRDLFRAMMMWNPVFFSGS